MNERSFLPILIFNYFRYSFYHVLVAGLLAKYSVELVERQNELGMFVSFVASGVWLLAIAAIIYNTIKEYKSPTSWSENFDVIFLCSIFGYVGIIWYYYQLSMPIFEFIKFETFRFTILNLGMGIWIYLVLKVKKPLF